MARTYSDLLYDDHNMLTQSQWPRQQREFADYLSQQGEAVQQIVAHYLSLRTHQTCKMAPRNEWLCGSFNVCIPVHVKDHSRVVIRLPLPHRFATRTCPDLANEKIRGEAATFAWLSDNCPNVPIPRFWGFGLSDGRSFTALAQTSWFDGFTGGFGGGGSESLEVLTAGGHLCLPRVQHASELATWLWTLLSRVREVC